MRSTLVSLFLAGIVLLTAGCGGGNPMVGTWKLVLNDDIKAKMPAGEKADVSVEFKADKTFVVLMDMRGRKEEISGTYELKDKTLTMHQKMEGGKPSDETQTATLSDDGKSFTAPGMDAMGKMVKQ